jgi:adenylate cyclase
MLRYIDGMRRSIQKTRYIEIGISVLITLFFLFLDVINLPVVKRTTDLLEMKTLDFRFLLREAYRPELPGENIAIIGIDEKSLREIGRWPWSRSKIAELLQALSEEKPRVVAFDVLFSEPERSDVLKLIQELQDGTPIPAQWSETLGRYEQRADSDGQFAEAIRQSGRVVLPFAMTVPTDHQEIQATNDGVPALLTRSSFGLVRGLRVEAHFRPIEAQSVLPPIERLAQHTTASGHVYSLPERDGVLRWEYLALKHGDDYYPSFGLQVAREALGLRREETRLLLGEAVQLGTIRIPTDERGRMLINYVGREGTYPFFSATDVLHRRIPPGRFRDKIILIGATAIGTYDLKVTPLSANMPGVEKNATVVDNILRQRFLHRTDTMRLLDALFILGFGVALGFILPRVSALYGATIAFALLGFNLLFSQYLFDRQGLWINLLYPTTTIVLSYTLLTLFRFMTEERQAREVRRMFSSYVSPKIVTALVKDPEKARLGGERKCLTILFSDIRGFTTYSERHTPEEVVTVLNEYMEAMTEVIFRWDGTLDKFIGDAIMVFWGAPLDQPDHAELAVRCALHMRHRLATLQEKWRAEGKEVLDTGIGINTGEVVVGNMGVEGKKMDYTVIGDHVNLAARMESLTREYNLPILLSESTYLEVKTLIHEKPPLAERRKNARSIRHVERRKHPMWVGHIEVHDLHGVKVKGKEHPVRAFGIVEYQGERHAG